jgi:HSP20 family molecular chaperone IbpA
MMEQADRLHRRFFQLEQFQTEAPTWMPPVDVFETERDIVIVAALPGVPADDLVVIVDEAGVSVRGQRPLPLLQSAAAAIVSLEIPYGRFERRIELRPGRYQIAQRLLQDGCLLLKLNRLE